MDVKALINIVISDLTLEIAKLNSKLESAINSNMDIDIKTKKIKKILFLITTKENALNKFVDLTTNLNNNNK